MINLIHGDCMEYMRGMPDKVFDLAIVDPPYGGGCNAAIGGRFEKYEHSRGGGKTG
jgi:DNA modification methylase